MQTAPDRELHGVRGCQEKWWFKEHSSRAITPAPLHAIRQERLTGSDDPAARRSQVLAAARCLVAPRTWLTRWVAA